MTMALVYDWLVDRGGGEKTLEAIAEMYRCPLYTLVHDSQKWAGTLLGNLKIETSFLQRLPFVKRRYRYYVPFFPLAIEQFNLNQYDVVLSVSHAVAKGVLTHSQQLHLCYCFTPMRYAWDLTHQYLAGLKGIRKGIEKATWHYLRQWDIASLNRVDYFAANSQYVARRIRKIYGRMAEVIYPPVDTALIPCVQKKESFFVTVSRMVPYKKIDLIVEAFACLPDQTLIVIGDGPEYTKIKKKAGMNVHLLGYQPDEVVRDYLGRAKGFVFAAEEDFGIIPVEAQAAGTPVVAFGRGGALETIIDQQTGLFFSEQTVKSLVGAISLFLKKSWDPVVIHQHAAQFSKERFQRELKQFVENKISESHYLSRG